MITDCSVQCVTFATRPLLLSVLKERLDKLDYGECDWKSFLAPIKSLIGTGIKSAVKTLQILSDQDSFLGKPCHIKSKRFGYFTSEANNIQKHSYRSV